MPLKVNNSEDNYFFLKMAHNLFISLQATILPNGSAVQSKVMKFLQFFRKKQETEKLTIKDGRSSLRSNLHVFIIRVS